MLSHCIVVYCRHAALSRKPLKSHLWEFTLKFPNSSSGERFTFTQWCVPSLSQYSRAKVLSYVSSHVGASFKPLSLGGSLWEL